MGRHSRAGGNPAHGRPEPGEPGAPGEPTGYQRVRPGEVAGAYPVATGSSSGYRRVPAGEPYRPAESAGYPPVSGPARSRRVPGGETSGYRRAPDFAAPGESTGRRRAVTGETSGYRRAQGSPALGESTGSRRVLTAEDSTGSPRVTGESSGYRRAPGGRRRAAASESTGSHRVPAGEATGSHRVIGETKRGIAKWPLVSGAFVLLLVLGMLGWGWADSILANRAEAQAGACSDGDSTLSVIAAPSVAPAITAAADRWNQANTVVHAHCVRVTVQAIDDQRVLLALTGRGNIDSIGGQPAVWIPETTATVTELTTARPTLVTSPAESLGSTPTAAYPCAVLTTDDVDEVQQRASQVFRNYLQEPAQKADFARLLPPAA